MSQLLQTLNFKHLSSELTDEEFDEFLCYVRRTKGRKVVLQLLCQQQTPSMTDEMHEIASIIIRKRENQKQEELQGALDKLPKSLIGKIASNLDQDDYAALSRTSRSVYIGCNDPNRLLSVFWYRGPIRFTQYPQIRTLHLLILNNANHDIVPFPDGNGPIRNQLKFLCLNRIQNVTDWLTIVQDNQSAFRPWRLRRLSLQMCDFPSPEIMSRLFTKFNLIHHLNLYLISLSFTYEGSFLKRLASSAFPQLDSLTLMGWGKLPKAFLQCRGSDLCQLDLDPAVDITDQSLFRDFKKVKFGKLQRLRIVHEVPSEITQQILETAPDIESACYSIRYKREQINNEKISHFISDILTKKEKLSDLYICTSHWGALECIGRAIEFALQSTKKRNRKLLRIGIECVTDVEVNETVVIMSRMLNRLLLCDIDEYALFMQLRPKEGLEESLIKDVKDLVDDLENVELVRSEGWIFIIRSKGCRISSYKKLWNKHRVIF